MAQLVPLGQISFTGGEVSPSLYGRVDISRYQNAVRRASNCFVKKEGGITKRPGTKFIGEIGDSTKRARLIPFEVSTEAAYVLEFGEETMRVIKLGGYLLDGEDVLEIATPYVEADLPALKFTQSADVLYLAHPSHAPRKLSRADEATWTLVEIDFVPDLAAPVASGAVWSGGTPDGTTGERYVVTAFKDSTGEESLPSNIVSVTRNAVWTAGEDVTVSWASVAGATDYNIYKEIAGVFGYAGTSQTTSFADKNYTPDAGDGPPVERNPFESSNHPGTVEFFEDRLVFAASDASPQTVWGSKTADYQNHRTSNPPKATDAIEFTLNARQVNKIQHILAMRNLLLLTTGAVWAAGGAGENQPISPASIQARVQSYVGCSDVRPLVIDDSALYVESKQRGVHDLFYTFQSDSFAGQDLSIMARHLFVDRDIEEWDFSREPNSIAWCVMSDGALLSLTYVRQHEISGWTRHETDGEFESVCSIPEGSEDAVYLIVKRTIDGVTKRYVERLEERTCACPTSAFFVDCGLRYDGAPTTTLTGLDHLEGKEVAVVGDGDVLPRKTVSGGSITLASPVSKASVGLPFTASLETLDLEAEVAGGMATRKRRVAKVHVLINETRGLFFGSGPGAVLDELKQRSTEVNYGSPIPLESGWRELPVSGSWGKQGRVYIESRDTMPFEILSIRPELVSE